MYRSLLGDIEASGDHNRPREHQHNRVDSSKPDISTAGGSIIGFDAGQSCHHHRLPVARPPPDGFTVYCRMRGLRRHCAKYVCVHTCRCTRRQVEPRWSPRRVMLLSEFGRGVAIGTVVATLAFGKPMVALLIAVAVIEGVLEVFSGLAERRYVGSIVGRDHVSSALVRIEARTHVAVVAGRPLGGLLFGFGPIYPFLADVASFIYSVAVLFGIKDSKLAGEVMEPPRDSASKDSLIADIRHGLRWIHEDKFARMVIISFSVGTLIFQALIIVFIGEAHSQQLSALAIGMVLAASGVGGALGSVVATPLLRGSDAHGCGFKRQYGSPDLHFLCSLPGDSFSAWQS